MTDEEFQRLRTFAHEHNRMILPGIGMTVLRPVRVLERLIRSDSFASVVEIELTNEHERAIRMREMVEDQPEILEKLERQNSDEVTICLGIQGPYRVRLDHEPAKLEMELTFSEWVSLVGIDQVPLVVNKIRILSGDHMAENLRAIRDDEAKGKILDRFGDAGILGKIYGVRPSAFLLGSDLEWEIDRICTDQMQDREKDAADK